MSPGLPPTPGEPGACFRLGARFRPGEGGAESAPGSAMVRPFVAVPGYPGADVCPSPSYDPRVILGDLTSAKAFADLSDWRKISVAGRDALEGLTEDTHDRGPS